jgi:hypothetical protein
MTAVFGGIFRERRIYTAPITFFYFQKQGFEKTKIPLPIGESLYTDKEDYSSMLNYLMPRPDSTWRSAMNILGAEEELVVTAFADTCKASDDFVCVTNDQDSQCKKLLQLLPSTAKDFIESKGLVGKEDRSFNRGASGPPGPKD